MKILKYSSFRFKNGKPSFIFNEGWLDFPKLKFCFAWNYSGLRYYLSYKTFGTVKTKLLTKNMVFTQGKHDRT